MTKEHYEKYDKLSREIGIEELKKSIPLTSEQIKEAITKDDYLNNIPLYKWDRWSGYTVKINHETQEQTYTPLFYGVWGKTRKMHLSLADRVCILKHVARNYMV